MNIAIYESDGITVLTHFTQWDTNRTIIISGLDLSEPPACQFYNAHSKRAIVVASELSGSDIIVPVPNLILQEGLSLIIDVYRETAPNGTPISDLSLTEGKVIYTFRVPVTPRPKPEDYEYTENIEYVSWAELSRRAEELLAKLEQTDFRRNVDTRFVQFTVDGETWKNLFSLDEIKGETGEIHDVTASVDDQFGTPYVDVTMGGTSIDRTFDLAFHNLRGFSPTAEVTSAGEISISTSVTGASVSVDRDTFVSKIFESGIYTFEYEDNEWTLDGEAVSLETYGITFVDVQSLLGDGDTITVNSSNDFITIDIEDINGRTTQILRRYASFLPTFDIDPLTGSLLMTAVSGYYDMEFYLTEENGHLNVREVG